MGKTIVIFAKHNSTGLASFLENTIGLLAQDIDNIEIAYERKPVCLLTDSDFKSISSSKEPINKWSSSSVITNNQIGSNALISREQEVENYGLACAYQTKAVYEVLKKTGIEPTMYGVDLYLDKHRNEIPELLMICNNFLNGCLASRNENIAENMLRRREALLKRTLQIVTIGPMHYELMYQLIAKKGYEFIENNFCFVHIYETEFEFLAQDKTATQHLFSPFNFLLFKEGEPKNIVQDKLLNLLTDNRSYLGVRSQETMQEFHQKLILLQEKEQPIDRTIRRLSIIILEIRKCRDALSREGLDENLLLNIILHLWEQVDVKELPSNVSIKLEQFLDIPAKKLSQYQPFLEAVLEGSKQKMYEENLFDTIECDEFLTKKNTRNTLMAIPHPSRPETNQFSCGRLFKNPVVILMICIVVAMAIKSVFYPEDNLSSLSLK